MLLSHTCTPISPKCSLERNTWSSSTSRDERDREMTIKTRFPSSLIVNWCRATWRVPVGDIGFFILFRRVIWTYGIRFFYSMASNVNVRIFSILWRVVWTYGIRFFILWHFLFYDLNIRFPILWRVNVYVIVFCVMASKRTFHRVFSISFFFYMTDEYTFHRVFYSMVDDVNVRFVKFSIVWWMTWTYVL